MALYEVGAGTLRCGSALHLLPCLMAVAMDDGPPAPPSPLTPFQVGVTGALCSQLPSTCPPHPLC